MTENLSTKLREEAWNLQNQASGKPGLTDDSTMKLPDDMKQSVMKLTSSALSLCSNFDSGYMAPADFESEAEKLQSAISKTKIVLKAYNAAAKEAAAKTGVKQKRVEFEEVVDFHRSDTDGSVEVALQRLGEGSLDFSGLKLSDKNLEELLEMMKCVGGTLEEETKFDLRSNCISDAGAQALAVFLASGNLPSLREVKFESNCVNESGRIALSGGLKFLRPELVLYI
jgi:Leucine Rich repeat